MYIIIETKELVSQEELRRRNPQTSFPVVWNESVLSMLGVAYVFPTPQPDYNRVTQTVREVAPILTEKGVWEQQWEVVSAFTEYIDSQGVLHTVAEQEDAALARVLANTKHNIVAAIKAERDRRTVYGGYSVAIEGVDKWFHSDVFSRNQQLGLVLMGEAVPVDLKWKTMDGTFVQMSPLLAQQVFNTAATSDAALFAYAENLIKQVTDSSEPTTVDISVGWPVCYLDLAKTSDAVGIV